MARKTNRPLAGDQWDGGKIDSGSALSVPAAPAVVNLMDPLAEARACSAMLANALIDVLRARERAGLPGRPVVQLIAVTLALHRLLNRLGRREGGCR